MNATVSGGGPQLRPLALGEVLDVAMKIVWRNASTLMRVVVVVVLPVQVIVAFVQLSALPSGSRFQNGGIFTGSLPRTTSAQPLTAHQVATQVTGFGVASVLGFLAGILAAGACYRAITSAYLGEQTGWRDSLAFAARRLHSILWVSIITGVISVLGLIACLLPGVYLFVSFTVAVPVLLTEQRRGFSALGRSRELVRGFWWRTLGIVVLGAILSSIVAGLLQALVLGLVSTGSSSAGWIAGTVFAGTLSKMITTPFTAAFVTVLYFDLRVRKEAFDLQLLAQRIGVDPGPGWAPAASFGSEQPPFWPPPPGWSATSGPSPNLPPAHPGEALDRPPIWPPPPE